MARYKADLSVWVQTQRGPDPTPEQVVEALGKLLQSDTMYVSVSGPSSSFAAARLAVECSEGEAMPI